MARGMTNAVSGGTQGVAPQPVTNITIISGKSQATLTWTDPQDTVIGTETVCTWGGTKVVANTTHYPTTPSDGALWANSIIRNQYQTNGLVVSGLTNEITYYVSFFPYSTQGVYNTNLEGQIGTATPQPYFIWTVKIDQTNSNPETSCTYADDAIGMTPASDEWDTLFGVKPCLFQNGVVVGYLNPNNFAQFVDGSTADITSGNAGDVMIEFPRMGLNISTDGSNVITISVTDNPNDSNFSYLAHTRGNASRDYFYLGAYKGYTLSSNLRSLSGKTPTANQTIGIFRTQAHNNGTGYENSGFYQLTFRQALYTLKYKNLNSQVAVGMGYVDGSSAQTTGVTNTNGMCYGSTSQTSRVKLFGLEDFWGNIWEWIDGCVINSSRQILTANSSFNDTGSGYTNNGQGATADIGNYMSKSQGGTKTGFIAKEVSGSATTYFCDYAALFASSVARFGGSWGNLDVIEVGAFRLYMDYTSSSSSAIIGARLMYL